MTDSLTTLISKTQNLLGDASGTYFTAAIVTAAVRQALAEYNIQAPDHQAVTIVGVNSQYEYELTDQDANAVKIIDVLLRGTDIAQDVSKSLTYDDYIEDERVWFRLRTPVTTSDTLIVRYTKRHIINGLDSQVESTIDARFDQVIVDGACFYAIITRATARIETINLSQEQSDNYREVSSHFRKAFDIGMTEARNSRRAPVSEPDTRAWNDQWHKLSWEQKPGAKI